MRVGKLSRATAALLVLFSAGAAAQNLDEYRRLTAAAEGMLDLIRTAQEEEVDALREAAASAELAVLNWLDAFFETELFNGLPPEQQAAAVSDRYRWEHNLSVQLIALGRCDEASERIRELLNAAYSDDELRPTLTETYERALRCVAEQSVPRLTALRFEVEPAGAEILVDNSLVGVAPLEHGVTPGQHTITVRAQGYVSHTLTVRAEGEAMALDPIVLQASDAGSSPAPGREPADGDVPVAGWVLVGVGVAGIGTSIPLFLAAGDRQDTVDNPPAGYFVVDPEDEQSTIDSMKLFAIISGGVGVAALVTGIVLIATHDGGAPEEGGEEPVSILPLGGAGTAGLQLLVTF